MDGEEVTVITADHLTYDAQEKRARFEGNVQVIDPGIKLESERLTALLDDESQVVQIEAVGSVFISQGEVRAWAGRAVYNVADGKVVLSEKPRVKRGKDLLEGERITLWRDNGRIVCEPEARLVIHPGKRNARVIPGRQP